MNELKITTVMTPAIHSCHHRMLQKNISRAKIIPECCIVTRVSAFSLNSGLSLRELHPFQNTGWNTDHLSHVLFFSLSRPCSLCIALQILSQQWMVVECIFTEIGIHRNKQLETTLLFVSYITTIKILN